MKNTKKMENFNRRSMRITFYVFYIIDFFIFFFWTLDVQHYPTQPLYTFHPTNQNSLFTLIFIYIFFTVFTSFKKFSFCVVFFFFMFIFHPFSQIFHARIFIEEHQQTTKNNWNFAAASVFLFFPPVFSVFL